MKALHVADFAIKIIVSFCVVTLVTAEFTKYNEFLVLICSIVFGSLETISWISRKTVEQVYKHDSDRFNINS